MIVPFFMCVVLIEAVNFSTVRLEEKYLGYDTWMPSAPKVEKPRSTYNAASLAYIGDCIYEVCLISCTKMGALNCKMVVLFVH